ncbi:MAG: hypothetical protein IJM57_03185, partial [Lachnospiraceae bacterium]|nr:hypothetical protein [Lachnospiraceae bacterium]
MLKKRICAVFLSIMMVFSLIPMSAVAAEDGVGETKESKTSTTVIQTADGEVEAGEDWIETYPFGTFAFGNYQSDIAEKGALTEDGKEIPTIVRIPVYRLGGTQGRVTAKIVYTPAVTLNADGTGYIFDYAASGRNDLILRFEDPMAIAAYQQLGAPDEILSMKAADGIAVTFDEPSGETKPEDELVLKLSGEVTADVFRWQAKSLLGWEDVKDAADKTLTTKWEGIWDFEKDCSNGVDYRCLYKVDGVWYCTDSLFGAKYVPIAAPEQIPDDFTEKDEPTYSTVTFDKEFDSYEFDLTFCDGETVKYIEVESVDDTIAELPEFGLFTIAGCEGGELSDTCNTHTLMISDNDEPEATEISFEVGDVRVDRSVNTLYISVLRTGGKTYNVSFDYETIDGTAKEGVDYAKKSGTVSLVGSLDEAVIAIELIDVDTTEDRTFTVKLKNVKGGGKDELCKVGTDEVTVVITGQEPEKKTDGSGKTLATVLNGSDGDDLSSKVSVDKNPLISDTTTTTWNYNGDQSQNALMATSEIVPATRSYQAHAAFTFTRSSDYLTVANDGLNNYWADWDMLGQNSRYNDITEGANTWNVSSDNCTLAKNVNNASVTASRVQWSTTTHYSAATQFSANYNSTVKFSINSVGKMFDKYTTGFHIYQLATNGNTYLRPSIKILFTDNSTENKTRSFDSDVDNSLNCDPEYDPSGMGNPVGRHCFWVPQGTVAKVHFHSSYKTTDGNANSFMNTFIRGIEFTPINFSAEKLDFSVSFTQCTKWSKSAVANNSLSVMNEASLHIIPFDDYDKTLPVLGNVTVVNMYRYAMHRRAFTNATYPVWIYTANDSDEIGSNGWAALDPNKNKNLYTALTPKISITQRKGGVNSSNCLYVGSTITIDCTNSYGFTVGSTATASNVMLINSNGEIKAYGKATDQNVFELTMLWDNMTEADLNDSYSIHVCYDRRQKVTLDIGSSVPRLSTDNMVADPEQVQPTWKKLFENGRVITVGYGTMTVTTNNSDRVVYSTATKNLGVNSFTRSSEKYTTNDAITNLQWICFNQDADDVILFKGHAFKGNERIPLTTADLASAGQEFFFYDSEYLDSISIMTPSIDHVELYYDGDADNKISGEFKDGIFTPAGKDVLIGQFTGEHYEQEFAPVVDSDGNVHQYFAKIVYTMRPRAYKLPAGADENSRAQVIPAFKTAVTDETEQQGLTQEQNDLKYIRGNNTDDHLMYGEAATALSFIDIPLGGDIGEVTRKTVAELKYDNSYEKVIDSESKDVYTWEPKYVGSLLFDYKNPSPISDDDNITGTVVSFAGESPACVNGVYQYSKEGLARMNQYLGALSGRSTIVVTVQEQYKALSKLSDPNEVEPECSAVADVSSMPNVDSVVNIGASTDTGDSEGTSPEGTGFDEFGSNLGIELPSLEFGFGDYATFVMDGNQIGFTIGIPLYKKEDTSYSADETTDSNGSTISKFKDDNGNPVTKTVDKNGITKTTTETRTDPDNDGHYKVTKSTVTEKPDGTKTYNNTTYTYKDVNGRQLELKKEVDTNAPPAPPATPQEKENGFKEANGQMVTLGSFISSIVKQAKGQNGSVKDFFKGAFEDDSFKNAKDGKPTSQKVSFSFSVQFAIMFEYNTIDDGFYFKSGAVSAIVGFEFTLQYRFTPAPILYVYVKTSISVEVSLGLSVDRRVNPGKAITEFTKGSLDSLKTRGGVVEFTIDKKYNGFNMSLEGSVYLEVFDHEPQAGEAALASGSLNGDGSIKEVSLAKYNKKLYIRLTAVGRKTLVTEITPFDAINDVYFDGVNISPSIGIEAGVGIGIELLKLEFYLKTNIAITITFGQYRPELRGTDKEYDPAYVSSFDWSVSCGFNVTILFINYSMDLIALSVHGEQDGTGGNFTWNITASAVGGNKTLWTKTTYTDAKGHTIDDPNRGKRGSAETAQPAKVVSSAKSLVRVSAPTDITSTQKVNSIPTTEEKLREIIAANEQSRAITPQGTKDFELSGYGTSGEARLLVSGLTTGYTYKLFEAGNENYVIYPMMIDDVPQLVMSKIIMVGDVSQGTGLQNPIEPTASDPYILLDTDGLADYDFDVDVAGEKVTAVWTAATADGGVCVKRASIDLSTDDKFAEPDIMTSGDAYRYLPNQTGDITVYVQNSGSAQDIKDDFKAYLIAKNQAKSAEEESLTAEVLDAGATDNALLAPAVYRYVLQSELADKQGSSSKLVMATTDADGTVTEKTAVVDGEIIENIEAVTIDGKMYVAYTTTKTAYFDGAADAPETVSSDEFNANTDCGNIRSLYIREVTKNGFGTAKLLQTIVDFDDCNSDNITSAKLKDGIYVNNSLSGSGQADPYYSNLKFLTAQMEISATAKQETFLLFEMGGNTYMVRNIAKIFGSSPSVTMTPIFQSTSGTDVTIGSDGTRLAVVYTAPMKNTSNNAIFVAWWDANVGGWGQSEVLAMRHLQIYEDSIAYDMNQEDTEKAYLGEIETPGKNKGSMSRLVFRNLQMSTHTENAGTAQESKKLLVLTEGSMVKLQTATYRNYKGENVTTVVPERRNVEYNGETISEEIPPSVNFYAIAFGEGSQALGEGILELSNYDFSAGSSLIGEVNFRNTGTTAIRASKANPMTITLNVANKTDSSVNQTIAKWLLEESIPSGGKVRLTFTTDRLSTSLPKDTTFFVTVTENEYFGQNAYSESLDNLLKVAEKPELAFSKFNAKVIAIENGYAIIDIDSTVMNVGNKEAGDVYIQFTYDTGKEDSFGQTYVPVDITVNSLKTSVSEKINRGTVAEDLKYGVYKLNDENGTGDIEPGWQRHVTGTIRVPITAFATEDNFNGLHLRAEIYSGDDESDCLNHIYSSVHEEYNSRNNAYEQTIQHATMFNVPGRISMALGTTLRMPVTFNSTSSNPEITVSEISNGSERRVPLLGIAYYDSDAKTIVIAANEEAKQLIAAGESASGFLQIQDTATNSIEVIAYKITEMGSGINIYKDDDSFTFYNADGTKTDTEAAASEHPGWCFSENVPSDAWKGGMSNSEVPMNADLSWANEAGAYLTFETTADTIEIYYEGSIEVTSDVLSEKDGKKVFTNPTGNPAVSAPASLNFQNTEGVIHTITIKALTEGTQIDRYTATYQKNPVVPTDLNAPQIVWSRSFPDTSSVMTGESVPMRCYIIDNSGISKVIFDGIELSDATTPKLVKVDDQLWYFDVEFTDNGVSVVRTYDTAGNTLKGNVRRDWFNTVLTQDAIGDAPDFTRDDLSFVDDDGNPISALNVAPWLKSSYELGETESSQAFLFVDGVFSEAGLAKDTEDEKWKVVSNGYYMVQVNRENGSWARGIVKIEGLDLSEPQLSVSNENGVVNYTASDDNEIASLTINGFAMEITGNPLSGTFDPGLSGEYTVIVTDDAGNTAEATVTVTVDLAVPDEAVETKIEYLDEKLQGSVTIDPTKLIGGTADLSISDPENGVYKTVYSFAVVAAGTDPDTLDKTDYTTIDGPTTIDGLAEGEYEIYVRDNQGNRVKYAENFTVYHPDDAWTEPT